MIYNVPRLGPNGGFIHKATHSFSCFATKEFKQGHEFAILHSKPYPNAPEMHYPLPAKEEA